jgi:hypothetical protein
MEVTKYRPFLAKALGTERNAPSTSRLDCVDSQLIQTKRTRKRSLVGALLGIVYKIVL